MRRCLSTGARSSSVSTATTPGMCAGRTGIDAADQRMRMRAAHEGGDQRAGGGDVVDKTALAGQQRLVFQAGDTRSDQFVHAVCLCWLNDSYVLLPLNRATSFDQMTPAMSDRPEIGLAAAGCISEDAGRRAPSGIGGVSASCARKFVANWPMICAAVASIMPTPRPYCATAPDSIRSVWISTFEPDAGWLDAERRCRIGAAAALGVAALRLDPRGVAGRVDLIEFDAAGKRQRHRAEADRNLALVVLRIDDLGQFGAGHAGRDARNIHQHRPSLRRRQRHVERIVEFHYELRRTPTISGAPILSQIQRAQANSRSSS